MMKARLVQCVWNPGMPGSLRWLSACADSQP